MPTVSCRPSRLLRFDELTVEIDSALRTRGGVLSGALLRYQFLCDRAYAADVSGADEAVRAWAEGHRRLGEWTGEVGVAFSTADFGPNCADVRPGPGGVSTVNVSDVAAAASPGVEGDIDPDLIGPHPAVLRPPILDTLDLSPAGAGPPLWQQVLDGGIDASDTLGAVTAVAALEPRGAHAVIPTRRIAVATWLGHAANGFSIAGGVQSGLDATRGRPWNDRVEAATVGAGVASGFAAAGAAAATSTAPYPLVAATAVAVAFAGGQAAEWAANRFADLGRRESPDGEDLDGLRAEIADEDPGDVLVAATELAAAEHLAATVGTVDPQLADAATDITGPIHELGAALDQAVAAAGDG